MGGAVKLSLTLITCGTCGKPWSPRHVCVTARKARPLRIGPEMRVTCGTCGRRVRNPLTHTCKIRSDFKRRKAATERRAKAERERQRRAAARARRRERQRTQAAEAAARRKAAARERKAKAAAVPRRRPPAHDPRLCKDTDCQRYGCVKYRLGYADGYADGEFAGYGNGFADGESSGFDSGFMAGAASATSIGGGRW